MLEGPNVKLGLFFALKRKNSTPLADVRSRCTDSLG